MLFYRKGQTNFPFSKKADVEVAQTYTWIQTHLEEDASVSLPKHEVYEDYRRFCQASKFEPLCVADYGKAMKHVFPKVKPRRLGQRGNSKYCYSGLRMKYIVKPPCLPMLSGEKGTESDCDFKEDFEECSKTATETKVPDPRISAYCEIVLDWASKMVDSQFLTMKDLSLYLIENEHVDCKSDAALSVITPEESGEGKSGIEFRYSMNSTGKESTTKKEATATARQRVNAQTQLQTKLNEKESTKEQKQRQLDQKNRLAESQISLSAQHQQASTSVKKKTKKLTGNNPNSDINQNQTHQRKVLIKAEPDDDLECLSVLGHSNDNSNANVMEATNMPPSSSVSRAPVLESCFEVIFSFVTFYFFFH